MAATLLSSNRISKVSLGKPSTNSKIENVVRQNEQIWHTLYDLKSTYPVVKGASKTDAPKVGTGFDFVVFAELKFPIAADTAIQSARLYYCQYR